MKIIDHKQQRIISLKKAKSLIETLIQMVEADKYCIDVMQQNLAVIGLLRNFHKSIMENHLNSCFKSAMNSENDQKKQQMINEIMTVTHLVNK